MIVIFFKPKQSKAQITCFTRTTSLGVQLAQNIIIHLEDLWLQWPFNIFHILQHISRSKKTFTAAELYLCLF